MTEIGEIQARGDVGVVGYRPPLGFVAAWSMMMLTDRLGPLGVGEQGHGRGLEDGRQGIGAALPVGALHQARAGVVAEAGSQFVPLGFELGLCEAVERLGWYAAPWAVPKRPSRYTVVADGDGSCRAGGVGAVVVAVGAIGIGELFPLAGDAAEHLEGVGGGHVDQSVDAGGELVAAARVGVQPGELTDLVDTEPAGRQRVGARRDGRGRVWRCGPGG